jgi:hypothetical protein
MVRKRIHHFELSTGIYLLVRAVGLACCTSLLLVVTSCTSERTSAAGRELVLTVREMVYHDGWKSCGAIEVRRDGNFCHKSVNLWTPTQPSKEYRGSLPAELVTKLVAVAQSSVVQKIGGIPTYDFYGDDHHFTHRRPEAILELVAVVNRAELTK